jgi:hypothetical protein
MVIEKMEVVGSQVKMISDTLVAQGYCYIDPNFYFDENNVNDLEALQVNYAETLNKKKDKGGRSRAYKRFVLWENSLTDVTGSYIQSKEYNKTDGGKKRDFMDISGDIITMPLFKKLLSINTSICSETGLINFKDKVSIGVHLIRYHATDKCPAYATPSGLHKDNENVVFIHMIKQSPDRVGGVNYIARDEDEIIEVIDLVDPAETLVLSKKYFHAVSPIGVRKGKKEAFRDVLIMTFESDFDFELRLQ